MVTLETVLNVIPVVSLVIVGAYYSLQIRNQNRTRTIQLLMQLSQTRTVEYTKIALELLNMEWEDYDDFERKYGSDVDPDNYGKRMSSLYRFNTMGLLLMKGHIDADTIFNLESGNAPLYHWTKFESVIKEQRRRYKIPNWCNGFEYLANESKKYLERQGFSSEIPETFLQYVPED